MIGSRWYTLTICVLAMTIAFISFQHYKYQQENNRKINNIEKYIRVLSKEFTDLKLELEEYEEPTDVQVSKYDSIDVNQEDDDKMEQDQDEDNQELKIEGVDIPSEDEIKNLLQNSIFTTGTTVMMGGDAQFMFQSNLNPNLTDPEITEITNPNIETDSKTEIEEDHQESDESAFTKDTIQFKTVQELKDIIIAKSGKLNWKLKKKAELVDEVVRLHNLAS